MHAIFRHDYPLAVEPASTPRPLVQKKTLRVSLHIDMLLSAVSVLVVAQSISEVPEGLTNNPVYMYIDKYMVGWLVDRLISLLLVPKEQGSLLRRDASPKSRIVDFLFPLVGN